MGTSENTHSESSSMLVECRDVSKRYGDVVVFENLSFCAQAGSFTSIVGPSGCGKSTLLAILGGLDTSYEGQLLVDGTPLVSADEASLDAYRREDVGFVFQDFNLIDHMTALDNVSVALQIEGLPPRECTERATKALDSVGLGNKLASRPKELSGGQAQRVAIARAMAKRPRIILADEPTGSLDAEAARDLAQALRGLADDGACVIVVTHDTGLFAPYSDAIVELGPGVDPALVVEAASAVRSCADRASTTPPAPPLDATAPASRRRGGRLAHSVIARMALSHMRSRLRRVIGAAAVCAVGMLGFGLLLSLLFGASDYSRDLQAKLLANIPVTITRELSIQADAASSVDEARESQLIRPDGSLDDIVEQALLPERGNSLSNLVSILEGDEANDPEILSVQRVFPLTNDVYVRTGDSWRFVDKWTLYEDVMRSADGSSMLAETLIEKMPDANAAFRPLISSDPLVLEEKYSLVGGRLPANPNEVVFVIRPDGTLGDVLLALLGNVDADALADAVEAKLDASSSSDQEGSIPYVDDVTVDELLSLDLAVLESCDYRVKVGDAWVNAWYDKQLIDEAIAQGTNLTVVGVVAPNHALDYVYDTGYIAYLPGLVDELVEHAEDSPVAQAQMNSPDLDVETNTSISQSNDLAQTILAQADTSGLDARKLEYLRGLSNARVLALLRSEGIEGRNVDATMISQVNDWIAETRGASYDQFASAIESVAPLSLDSGVGSILLNLDVYGSEDMQEIRVFVDSIAAWKRVVERVESYSDMRTESGLSGVSVSYSGEIAMYDQVMQVMYLVVGAFAIMSVLVILVTLSSTMSTFVAERTHEIGCLRAMGMSRRSVGMLFMFEAVAIGVAATVAGAIVVAVAVGFLNAMVEGIMGSPDLFRFDLVTFVAMLLASLVLCTIASIVPARNAARKDPVSALGS